MDRWQAEMGRVREEKRRRSKKRKSQKKEDPGAQKGRKVAKHYVFPMICGSRGSKSRLKRRVQSQLARWEMKNCTPLWREAHFQIKMYKSAFRSCDVERDRKSARRSRSTFRSQKCKKLTVSEHFWKLRCRKSARRCGAKHISKSKVQETEGYGALLDVQMWFCVAVARDCAPFQKWAKRAGFVAFRKTIGRRGTFEEDLQRYIFRGRRSTRDMFIRDVRRSGHWFPERLHFGASDLQFWKDDFAWQVRHFVWLGITFSRQALYFRQVAWKNRKTHWYEALSSALNFQFLKEVSQDCFVFDVVTVEKWESLAELLRFCTCRLRKLRKSRRLVSFLTLSSSKTEEVSQNSLVFKLADCS